MSLLPIIIIGLVIYFLMSRGGIGRRAQQEGPQPGRPTRPFDQGTSATPRPERTLPNPAARTPSEAPRTHNGEWSLEEVPTRPEAQSQTTVSGNSNPDPQSAA
jgi:hypothetical protein